jgi:hypothetical protein
MLQIYVLTSVQAMDNAQTENVNATTDGVAKIAPNKYALTTVITTEDA